MSAGFEGFMSLIDNGHASYRVTKHTYTESKLLFYCKLRIPCSSLLVDLLMKVLLKSCCHPYESIHFQFHFLPALTPNPATKPSDSLLPLD